MTLQSAGLPKTGRIDAGLDEEEQAWIYPVTNRIALPVILYFSRKERREAEGGGPAWG